MIAPSVRNVLHTEVAEIFICVSTRVKDLTNVNIVKNDFAFRRIYVITLEHTQVSVDVHKDLRENGQLSLDSLS